MGNKKLGLVATVPERATRHRELLYFLDCFRAKGEGNHLPCPLPSDSAFGFHVAKCSRPCYGSQQFLCFSVTRRAKL
jgi:hypothetical protein